MIEKESLIILEYLKRGLVPHIPHKPPCQFFDNDSRVSKRKFRKYYKKARKLYYPDMDFDKVFGPPHANPTTEQIQHRKKIVYWLISDIALNKF